MYCILVTKTKGKKNAVFFLLPILIPFKFYYSLSEDFSRERTNGVVMMEEFEFDNSLELGEPIVFSLFDYIFSDEEQYNSKRIGIGRRKKIVFFFSLIFVTKIQYKNNVKNLDFDKNFCHEVTSRSKMREK